MSRWDDIQLDTPAPKTERPWLRCQDCGSLWEQDDTDSMQGTCKCGGVLAAFVPEDPAIELIAVTCEANTCALTFFRKATEPMAPPPGVSWEHAPRGWLVKGAASRVVVLCPGHAAGVPGVRY